MKSRWMLFPLFLSAVALTGCSSACEHADAAVLLMEQIDILDRGSKKSKQLSSEMYIAIFFLEDVTAIKSSVDYGDTSVYNSKADYASDKKKWTKWIAEHGCDSSKQSLQEARSRIISNTDWLAPN